MLGEGAQAAVSGDLLDDRERAVFVFELADAGVPELVQRPTGCAGEQLGGAAVGQAGAAGGGVAVSGGDGPQGLAVAEEQWSAGAVVEVATEQVGGVGVPVDLAGLPAFADHDSGLGVHVEVFDVEFEDFFCSGGGVVKQPPQGSLP